MAVAGRVFANPSRSFPDGSYTLGYVTPKLRSNAIAGPGSLSRVFTPTNTTVPLPVAPAFDNRV